MMVKEFNEKEIQLFIQIEWHMNYVIQRMRKDNDNNNNHFSNRIKCSAGDLASNR